MLFLIMVLFIHKQRVAISHKVKIMKTAKQVLFEAITEDVNMTVTFAQMEVIKEVAFANGITRNDIVKAWSEEQHPSESGIAFEDWRAQESKYSAITATFDYYAHKAGLAV